MRSPARAHVAHVRACGVLLATGDRRNALARRPAPWPTGATPAADPRGSFLARNVR